MALFNRPRFSRSRTGEFAVRLGDRERDLLRSLPAEMEALVSAPAPEAGAGVVRLFPPAYLDDSEFDAEYHRLMRDELLRRRLEALSTLRDTLDRPSLTENELGAWMRVINDVRLVLGTILDVSEDSDPLDVEPSDPSLPQRLAYVVLSDIVADAVDALTGSLGPPVQE